MPIPTLLMNSPTFNTLDNRFVELNNPDSSRLHYNADGDPMTPRGSVMKISKNLFTNSPWPGLRNVDSVASEPAGFRDTSPRSASPMAELSKDGCIKLISGADSMLEPAVHQASYMDCDNMAPLLGKEASGTRQQSHQDSGQSQTNRSDKSKRKQPSQGAKVSLNQSQEDRSQRARISPSRPATPQN